MATPRRTSATSSTTRSKKTAASKAQETNTTLPQSTQPAMANVEELIRFRAYQLFVQRGGTHGFDMEDWLRAESEVTANRRAHSA